MIMDSIDYRILKILQKNARETASNISKEIHLSVSAVTERIRKMEENDIIKTYTIIVNERLTGYAMTVLMEVSLEKPQYYDKFVAAVEEMDEVVACYYKTGAFDLLLKICCESGDELASIHRNIMNIDGVSDTRTDVVIKNVKNSYSAIREPKKI